MKYEKDLNIILKEEIVENGIENKVNINFDVKIKEIDYSIKNLDYLKVYNEFSDIYEGSNQSYQGLIHNSKSDPDYNHLF